MRTWLVWLAGALGAATLVITNLNTILSAVAPWIGPYVESVLSPHSDLSIALDAKLTQRVEVYVVDSSAAQRPLAVDRAGPGASASLKVPANRKYAIGWQGAGIAAGVTADVLAPAGRISFVLIPGNENDGLVTLKLHETDGAAVAASPTLPNAAVVLSAQAAQVSRDPDALQPASVLPELDRAIAVIGLFETGATDCARRIFFLLKPMAGARFPIVGCLGMSVPGLLAEVLMSLDAADDRKLDGLLGPDDAAMLRQYVQDARPVPRLQPVMERLALLPEFWIACQTRILGAYAAASTAAREIGLTSERSRLLLLDRLVQTGPGNLRKGVEAYAARHPKPEPPAAASEAAEIRELADIFIAGAHFQQEAQRRRIETITTGHGSFRGIDFDLDALGIHENPT